MGISPFGRTVVDRVTVRLVETLVSLQQFLDFGNNAVASLCITGLGIALFTHGMPEAHDGR